MKKFAPLALLAATIIIGTGYIVESSMEPAQAATATRVHGPSTMSAAIADADTQVAAKRSLLAEADGEWLRGEVLAIALMERFRLTGELSDLTEARALLDSANEAAPRPSGPNLNRAPAALTLHDLAAAEQSLARFRETVVQLPDAVAAADAMAGDIAFQRGDLAAAERFFERSNGEGDIGSAARLANVALWRGEPGEARTMLTDALAQASTTPESYARSALQLANIAYARGDTDDAGHWVEEARDAFGGFWLADVYGAQQLGARGDWAGAIARLERIATESGDPEVMDLLAGFLRHDGADERAARWIRKADAAWAEKLASAPDAYRHHAAEHHLDFGDPAVALDLARVEVGKRPFGEAIEVYASALTATGNPREALRWLERAEARGFRSVSLDMARGEALDALNRSSDAERYYRRAEAINPAARGDLRKLLRFGHY